MKLFKNTLLFGGLAASRVDPERRIVARYLHGPLQLRSRRQGSSGRKVQRCGTGQPRRAFAPRTEPNPTAMVLVTESPAALHHDAVTFNRRGSAVMLSTVTIANGSTFSLFAPETKNSAAQ